MLQGARSHPAIGLTVPDPSYRGLRLIAAQPAPEVFLSLAFSAIMGTDNCKLFRRDLP